MCSASKEKPGVKGKGRRVGSQERSIRDRSDVARGKDAGAHFVGERSSLARFFAPPAVKKEIKVEDMSLSDGDVGGSDISECNDSDRSLDSVPHQGQDDGSERLAWTGEDPSVTRQRPRRLEMPPVIGWQSQLPRRRERVKPAAVKSPKASEGVAQSDMAMDPSAIEAAEAKQETPGAAGVVMGHAIKGEQVVSPAVHGYPPKTTPIGENHQAEVPPVLSAENRSADKEAVEREGHGGVLVSRRQ